jgi:hypothetical protein
MRSIADEQGLSAKDIPSEFDGLVKEANKTFDETNKRPTLTLKVAIDGQTKPATLVYKPMHVERMLKELERLNVKDIKGVKFHWVKTNFDIGFARPIPVRVIQ